MTIINLPYIGVAYRNCLKNDEKAKITRKRQNTEFTFLQKKVGVVRKHKHACVDVDPPHITNHRPGSTKAQRNGELRAPTPFAALYITPASLTLEAPPRSLLPATQELKEQKPEWRSKVREKAGWARGRVGDSEVETNWDERRGREEEREGIAGGRREMQGMTGGGRDGG